MKLYEFKNIKIDLVLTEDIIPEDKLQEIIQSDDIIKLARKKTYEHLLRARRKSKELKTESRKKIARKMIVMRERIRKNNKIKLDKEVNQSIKWVKDIQAIELVLMQDIMNKVHLSLTNALHSLDTSSRINWDDLLNEVVRETLSNNNIVGAIKITKNPDIKLDPGEANNIQLINDANTPHNKIIIENEYIRITLDPLEQISILLNSFKDNYLALFRNDDMSQLMTIGSQPIFLIIVFFLLSLLPIFVVIGTSFLKISIVLGILKNALGIQQVPPNMALTSVSLILTMFIMSPIILQINDNISQEPINYTDSDFFQKVDEKILSPYRGFLEKNTEKDNVEFFERAAQKKLGNETILKKDSLFILLPAFTMGQLEAAFKIGFLLYLPFIAIDLIISNILLALGMMMVSPVTISIPFKILLFILVGGWQKLFEFLLVVN